jgi:hypothetical protein
MFPCKYEYIDKSFVVEFINECEGFVVAVDPAKWGRKSDIYDICHYSCACSSCFNKNYWTKVDIIEITLNKAPEQNKALINFIALYNGGHLEAPISTCRLILDEHGTIKDASINTNMIQLSQYNIVKQPVVYEYQYVLFVNNYEVAKSAYFTDEEKSNFLSDSDSASVWVKDETTKRVRK